MSRWAGHGRCRWGAPRGRRQGRRIEHKLATAIRAGDHLSRKRRRGRHRSLAERTVDRQRMDMEIQSGLALSPIMLTKYQVLSTEYLSTRFSARHGVSNIHTASPHSALQVNPNDR